MTMSVSMDGYTTTPHARACVVCIIHTAGQQYAYTQTMVLGIDVLHCITPAVVVHTASATPLTRYASHDPQWIRDTYQVPQILSDQRCEYIYILHSSSSICTMSTTSTSSTPCTLYCIPKVCMYVQQYDTPCYHLDHACDYMQCTRYLHVYHYP